MIDLRLGTGAQFMNGIWTFIPLVARLCLVAIFVQSGFSKVVDFGGTAEVIASQGLPFAPMVTVFTILFELVGATLVILGYKPLIGAGLLVLFLIPTTLVFHNFITDPTQLTQFLKNLSILGGLLMVIAFGSGPMSLTRGPREGGF